MLIVHLIGIFFLTEVAMANGVSLAYANAATKKLNSQPAIALAEHVSKTQPSETILPLHTTLNQQKNLKVIDRLTKVYDILKAKEDVRLPFFLPTRVLHPSDKDDAVVLLREILQSLGYLDKATDSPFYDVALEEAVKDFQLAHCIEPDGVIGEETKVRLNWSFGRRLQMLQESIDNLKKLVFASKTIIVNVPTYQLYCFQDDKQVMEMKTIVGQPKRATPLMTSYINAITYYPEWVVPKRIFFQDKLPAIQKDEEYFEKNNLKIFEVSGDSEEERDAGDIDWSEVHERDFPYRIKQKPGKKNALGVVQFMLVNDDQIYLHDTPQKSLFKKVSRALSSGCIRVEKPMTLAAWMLRKDKDAVEADLETVETKVKGLKDNVLVQIAYLPVWVAEDGKILWGDDPYKLQTQPQT